MIIDDKRVALRLREHPEFLLRLDDFVSLREVNERPALIAQARLVSKSSYALDVDSADMHEILRAPVGSDNYWWGSLQGGWTPKPAVDLTRFGLANPAAV